MIPKRRRLLLVFLIAAAYAVLAPLALRAVVDSLERFRIELGASDDSFLLGNQSSWGRAYRDSGPFRLRRGQRWMTHFAARMAFPEAGIRIPARVVGADGELSIRAHRYGQEGVIRVFGNGILLGRIVFEHDTYPWEVFRFPVPETLFRAPELELEFRGESLGGQAKLPPEALLSFDWLDLRPDDPGKLRLTTSANLLVLLTPVALALLAAWGGGSLLLAAGCGALAAGLELLALSRWPAHTAAALEHLPFVFPLVVVVYVLLRWPFGNGRARARALSAGFGFVLLAHSTIIFFPDHQPPDLGPHLGQIWRLKEGWSWDQFWEYSSAFGEEGRGKPHFGANYEAPYPPWTYMLVHALRALMDHPRFWLEFVGMVSAALIGLLVFALASRLARDERAPWLAFLLFSLEISTWHHAARVHTPGLVGELFFVGALTYLVFRYDSLHQKARFASFVLLSLLATLLYTATLFHFVVFMACFVVADVLMTRKALPSPASLRALGAAALGTLGAFAVFYHRFVPTALASRSAILAEEGYRAPATFFLLRNQMRDTARILGFGYPLFALLAIPAYLRLPAWTTGALARRTIAAWTATYAFFLVMKDPMFFPQLFLHVKEDLLFAPLMCVLGGMTLAAAWRHHLAGKVFVVFVLGLFLVLQSRDYAYNADTIAEPAAFEEANE